MAMARLDELEKRRITAAVVGSVILHLLFAVAAGIVLTQELASDEPEPEPPPPVELTILRPEPPVVPPQPRFMNTPEDLATETIPEVPVFESDKNTLAASEVPVTGEAPLPSQEGLDRPSLDLVTREYAPGELEPPQPALPPVPPVEMASLARPTPRPVEPEPEPEPAPTPPDAMPLAPPRPTPVPQEEVAPEPTPVEETVDAVPQPPTPPTLPTYQPLQERTRIEGSIDTRGRSSVDAVGTPLGRYQKHLSDAIGSRWNFYIGDSMSMVSVGTVRIRFYVAADGSIQDLRILRNNSNDFFATRSVQAIMDAEIPPIPPDIAATLDQNRLEVEYNFTVYGR